MKRKGRKDRLFQLIQAIQQHAEFEHSVESFELLETHISYILLTGPFAYKFKKPVNLGFLDFSTLMPRKFYCEEEIRLNRRLAPEIYVGVVSITGTEKKPNIGGTDQIIEYAVKMVQFPKGSELDQVLNAGRLKAADIDNLAKQVVAFHENVNIATKSDRFGSTASIKKSVLDNFDLIRPIINDDDHQNRLNQLEVWTIHTLKQLEKVFNARKQYGYVRECHGDLHIGNIALLDDKPLIFDCIEFSQELRWIDVISEIAFLIMDLDVRGQPEFAQRFLNHYLQASGDYEGLTLLRFYRVYRALVRCKVACIRYKQTDPDQSARLHVIENYRRYLDFAYQYIQPINTPLIITHGLSASGKTTYSQKLLENLGAIRIRSDVERKREHGIEEHAKSGSDIGSGIYSAKSTAQTYERLAALAKIALNAGYPVIVDATFLYWEQRKKFRNIAYDRGLPFVILDFQAEEEQLRERIIERQHNDIDASEANLDVLYNQIDIQELLDTVEITHRIIIDISVEVNWPDVLNQIKQKITHNTSITTTEDEQYEL